MKFTFFQIAIIALQQTIKVAAAAAADFTTIGGDVVPIVSKMYQLLTSTCPVLGLKIYPTQCSLSNPVIQPMLKLLHTKPGNRLNLR